MSATETEFLRQIASNTGDKVVLLQEEITLSNSAQSPAFTGIAKTDVYAIELRVRKVGSPVDSGYIALFTVAPNDTPVVASSHGQYLGNGDIYEITGQANVANFKIIATESLAHICHIIYYGKSQN